MTTPISEFERQIEQATRDQGTPETPLDNETARLRETWLTLGQLLNTAHPERELPPCQIDDYESGPTPATIVAARPSSNWAASAIALAACLLVATVGLWVFSVNNDHSPRDLAETKSQQPPTVEIETYASLDDSQMLAWDDSLDERLLYAWSQVSAIQSNLPKCDMIQAEAAGYADWLQQDLSDDSTM